MISIHIMFMFILLMLIHACIDRCLRPESTSRIKLVLVLEHTFWKVDAIGISITPLDFMRLQ